jgi:hypothetical protein
MLSENSTVSGFNKIKSIAWIAGGSILLITILAFTDSTLLKQITGFGLSGIRERLKIVIENISLADTIAINGLIQLVFIAAFLFWAKKYSRYKKIFSLLWIANLFIMAQLVLPITFVSKTSPHEINSFIHASPKGFPTIDLEKPIGENSVDALDHFDKIALSYFYNKKIGISGINNSPSFLDEQNQFLKSKIIYNYISSKPVVYMADSVLSERDSLMLDPDATCTYAITDLPIVVADSCTRTNKAILKNISANRFEIETESYSTCLLVLTQSYHHHWKVWVDGLQREIYKTNFSFMSTSVPAGKHKVIFQFYPSNTLKALWVMLAMIAILIIAGTVSLIRQYKSRLQL